MRLAEKTLCAGCSACVSICPRNCLQMEADQYGFLYPQIRKNDCFECGLCEKICPVMNKREGYDFDEIVYAAYSTDADIRRHSSSGGLFTEIAKVILNDGGFIYGASYNQDFSVSHVCVNRLGDLYKLRGAKYAQSDLNYAFRNIRVQLNEGKKILFVGTPCQVGGLMAFLGRNYNNLVCVDFVCHGIPSAEAWRKYVEYRAKKDNKGKLPLSINMRSKESGWSYYHYSSQFYYSNRCKYTVQNGYELFMKLFIEDCINRESCAHCVFKGYKRLSDITIGDFWGIWDVAADFDDNRGTSLAIIHSSKGEAIFNKLKNNIKYLSVEIESAYKQNPSLIESSKCNPNRDFVLQCAVNGKYRELQRTYLSTEECRWGKIKKRIINYMAK